MLFNLYAAVRMPIENVLFYLVTLNPIKKIKNPDPLEDPKFSVQMHVFTGSSDQLRVLDWLRAKCQQMH